MSNALRSIKRAMANTDLRSNIEKTIDAYNAALLSLFEEQHERVFDFICPACGELVKISFNTYSTNWQSVIIAQCQCHQVLGTFDHYHTSDFKAIYELINSCVIKLIYETSKLNQFLVDYK